ncbi:hypothetical protein EVA_17099 [gut metagenome]|uniref:Uncharacterized protein n=1 Tax=gut metagenome TaxID=749906 RepID=J9G5J9_9ZZZZ
MLFWKIPQKSLLLPSKYPTKKAGLCRLFCIRSTRTKSVPIPNIIAFSFYSRCRTGRVISRSKLYSSFLTKLMGAGA